MQSNPFFYWMKNQRISNFENQENFIQQLVSVSYVKIKKLKLIETKYFMFLLKNHWENMQKRRKMRFLAEKVNPKSIHKF